MKVILHPAKVDASFDLFISVLGYEDRAIFAPQRFRHLSKKIIALRFVERNELNFSRNKAWYEANNSEIVDYIEADFQNTIEGLLNSAFETGNAIPISIGVDVSSMSRPMIAQVCVAVGKLVEKRAAPATITIVYCPASYAEPNSTSPPIVKQEPVIPALAGWPLDSAFPSVAIFGLGYESDYALGTSEYLEASRSWAFFPTGEDERYDRSVSSANKTFLDLIGKENILHYRVDDPLVTFATLESLLANLVQTNRTMIVPLGPKIFAALAVLVSLRFSSKISMPLVSVWRVSGDQTHKAIERTAKGNIIQFCAAFSPN